MSASAASGRCVVGTPEKVADAIEAWFDQTDVDGLNVPFAVSPGDFEDIADMLVPELVRRGRYKAAYRPRNAARKTVRRRPRAARSAASGRAVSAAHDGEGGGVAAAVIPRRALARTRNRIPDAQLHRVWCSRTIPE